jgi:hypothetical protein
MCVYERSVCMFWSIVSVSGSKKPVDLLVTLLAHVFAVGMLALVGSPYLKAASAAFHF